MTTMVSNEEKARVWQAYHERKPIRVPLRWNVNARVLLLNPALNPDGIGFQEFFQDPQISLLVQVRFAEYLATTLSQVCDYSWELPESWTFGVTCQNTYDAAYFGAEVRFEPGQVPGTHQFLSIDDVDWFLAQDYSRPLENPWLKQQLAFREALIEAARDFRYLGRGGTVAPFGLGFDGPLTVATNLFGEDIFTLLGEDPEKAVQVLTHIINAAVLRNYALADLAGQPRKGDLAWSADDSIQLISTSMYEEYLLPLHELVYRSFSTTTLADHRRFIHLCGDATRHFKTIKEKLGVYSFDTGFPVDHGHLREELGEEVEISGGPRVDLLLGGTPAACAAETKRILQSGIMRGGRFILQEANNLPPCVPMENLQAVYATCLEYGRYEQ